MLLFIQQFVEGEDHVVGGDRLTVLPFQVRLELQGIAEVIGGRLKAFSQAPLDFPVVVAVERRVQRLHNGEGCAIAGINRVHRQRIAAGNTDNQRTALFRRAVAAGRRGRGGFFIFCIITAA